MSVTPLLPKWPGTMTDRERFLKQLKREPVDRCFNMEFGYWRENFEHWRLFRENGITNNYEADLFFNFDRTPTVGGNTWMSPPFPYEVVEETEHTQIVTNEDGLLAEVPKKEMGSSIPHFMKSSIETPEDWARVKAERFNVDDPARVIDIEAVKAGHANDGDRPMGIWVGSMIGKVRDMLTVEGLAYACEDYPEMVEDMVETSCQLVEHVIEQLLGQVRFDFASGWEDICFKSGPLVTLDFFEHVVCPRYKRISERLKAHGVETYYIDCDGDVRPLIPYFLEAGVNTMFPWEVNGSGHPGEALDRWGPELRIMGGVDKMQLGAGREAIRAELERLAPWVEKGGFIPFCDHRCPPNVNEADYLYYLELKEQMFGMRGLAGRQSR